MWEGGYPDSSLATFSPSSQSFPLADFNLWPANRKALEAAEKWGLEFQLGRHTET